MGLQDLKDKKIVILGFSREGKDTFLALRKLFPQKTIGIADEKPIDWVGIDRRLRKNTVIYSGKNYLASLKKYNLIIKTPGIPQGKIKLRKEWKESDSFRLAKITSQTKVFFDNCPGLIIGVTGTKGKGTTASLIYSILKADRQKAHLVGNIGRPVFQLLLKAKPNDIFIYELSSHQLQGLKKSPDIAVFLNLFSDHLDYYKNIQEYRKAKQSITMRQKKSDFFIYNAGDKLVCAVAKKSPAGKKIAVRMNRKTKKALSDIISLNDIPLKGDFNLLNIVCAVKTAEILNIPKAKIKQGIKNFKGLPCRLEFIGKHKGIAFYDDSMSTIPEVTIAALGALGRGVATLILGGSDKGSDYKKLAEKIIKNNLKTLIFLTNSKAGDTGQKIWTEIKRRVGESKTQPAPYFVNSMEKAVAIAYQNTKKGEICLLSPGSASFNLFSNYKERGDLFKKFVKQLAKDN